MKILTPNLVLESAHRRGFWRKAAEGNRNSRGVRGLAHFCFREGFMCLLMICKGTFPALKKLIFHFFFLDIYHCRQNGMFFCQRGKLVVNSDDMTTDQKH